MTSEVFGDTSWVNENEAVTVFPPTVQWRRGDLTNANALLKHGCWQLAMENFISIAPASWEPVDVVHAGGAIVTSFLLREIHLAIVAYRKRWFYLDPENKPIYLPPNFDASGKSIKSRVQIWALCKELDNQPVIVSTAGMNSKFVLDAMDAFIKQVITPASRLAKIRFARYHFWLPLATAGKQATKNNQYITPPVMSLEKINDDILRGLFTGKEVATLAEAELPAAKEWAAFKNEPVAAEQAPPNFPDTLIFENDEVEF